MGLDTSQLQQWFSQNVLLILAISGLLVVLYAYSGRFVRRIVQRTLSGRQRDLEGSGVEHVELEKRADTIEALVTTIIRLSIVSLGIFFAVGITGTWGILVAVGLFLAAVTVAGQSIVMDYLMGVLIIVEGTFFKGDSIELGTPPWKGTVEDVGLRRTAVRAVDGTVYSISNAELRLVANRTRIYAAAEVRIRGIRQGDLHAAIEVMERVAAEVASDPAFSEAVIEVPTCKFVDDADELGNIAVLRGKVVASERWRVASEIRLRLDGAFAAAGLELDRQAIPAGALGRSPR